MRKEVFRARFASVAMVILILDTKTAISGMAEGISICLQTLIPSLFPFMLLSCILRTSLHSIPFLRKLCRLLPIPEGAETIFLIGLLGGYPVGAQCIGHSVQAGNISRENGERMLAFCCNAGPAFIFGLGIQLFPSIGYCWWLWIIHVISALLVGLMIPAYTKDCSHLPQKEYMSMQTALQISLRTMGSVCGWVVLFRVIIAFCQRWFLWLLPQWLQLLFCGMLELANGCYGLAAIDSLPARFLLFSALIGFGGCCVAMQTQSTCDGMRIRWYWIGKTMQTILSCLLSAALISREMRVVSLLTFLVLCSAGFICSKWVQKRLAFSVGKVYNQENLQRGNCHAVSQKDRTPVRLLHPQHSTQ